jgi:meiotic recombination protein DMC1
VGSKEVDTILGGGVETCSITELYGEFRTGKTQWCHMLCVTSQMPVSHGGGEGKACYIDTEGTFRPERIKEIAARYGLDGDAVLGNIIWARIFTVDNLMSALNEVAAQFAENPFRVLIVDSIMGLLRVDYQGRGELSERQQRLGCVMSRLTKIANEFNIAVVVTNHVMADPSGLMFAGADNKKPIGGHVIAHASTTRLYLKKGKGGNRVCSLTCSPYMPEADAPYSIGEGGIDDVKD